MFIFLCSQWSWKEHNPAKLKSRVMIVERRYAVGRPRNLSESAGRDGDGSSSRSNGRKCSNDYMNYWIAMIMSTSIDNV